jgi:pimeloyl-ACP methyl ester carboxylesterase
MHIEKNIIISIGQKKSMLADVYLPKTNDIKPIVIFCHGYKGFKDWGAWHLMIESIAHSGFCGIKFNFSHNGGTMQNPIDFPDLDAFGNNNYTKELNDLNDVLNWVQNRFKNDISVNENEIYLIGHSRAGGIVSIKTEEDSRIKKVISLAGVCDYKSRFVKGNALDQWQKDGVFYVVNGRTKQQMPHYYQFYKDFIDNEKRLTIKRAVTNINVPHLIIHGSGDTAVKIEDAKNLHAWNPKSELVIIDNADHVFNTKHPWALEILSKELENVVNTIVSFFKS